MAKINFLGNIESSEIINRFNSDDLSLTGTQIINSNFNPDTDYIEYVIYDTAGNFLNIDYSYTNYKLPNNSSLSVSGSYPQLDIEPIEDLRTYSDYGEFISQYSFFKPQISDVVNQDLFIKEISPDRTEIKVASVNLTKTELENQTRALINDKDSVPYLKTYLLNFGLNDVYVITNIALDTTNPIESYIYFKLYEPLPSNIAEKAQFCVVEEITNSYKFNINLATEILPDPLPQLKGPNFDVDINFKKNTLPTQYESYSTLLQFTGSSLHAILNHLDQTSIDINVDYTDFTNFSRFGSAQKRVENFYNKVKQIEDYNNFITTYTPFVATTASLQLQINQYSSSINDIVSKFDGYESYLYLQTGSNTYPHSNTTVPYIQQSTGSAAAIAWYTAQTDAAIYYDINNQDNLVFLIPEYIRIDENNAPYLTFVNMIGQYFDNIYIYLKSVTDLYKSYNNLEEGVSKDLVYYALQDLGVDIYNSNEDDDLSTYAIAVSGSNIPSKDLVAELYKRIYHNIPLLFKGKGSRRGMQELITTFGITGSILNIKEYGGDSNTQASLIDYSNSKVRIIDNSIYNQSYYGATGSVLSPDIRLSIDNTYTNYKNDSDRVDISFSPYNQIDTTISASIATTYPTFSIDDYIGDPRNASQTEYGVLNSIRETAIDSSFTYKYDINGFIQLIKFFDNTLFKMLKSYVPAKANLNEGITIRQQALERIKFKRNEPNVTEQTVYDAEYSSPEITEDNTYLYEDLAGNKGAFYTGEITGSYINVGGEYAVQWNPYSIPTSSIDQNIFNHTDYNVLLNNVSASKLSLDRFKIETIPTYSLNYTNPQEKYTTIPLPGGGGTSIAYTTYDTYSIVNYNILTPVELQDSYESLTSYQLSRHEGVKLTGLKYNTFSTKSLAYDGDISYGNNAVIDRYSSKIGIFTSVDTSSFFLNKSDVTLKYLVDINGNITELNGGNYYWQDVQSIFKDSTLTVSLFDPKKYGNQRRLDGTKNIYSSGYSYYPTLYYTGSDKFLYFRIAEPEDRFLFTSAQTTLNVTSSIDKFGTKFKVSPTFNTVLFNDLNLYHTGSNILSSSFTSSYDGTYIFNTTINYTFQGPTELISNVDVFDKTNLLYTISKFTQAGGANFKFTVKNGGTVYGLTGSFAPKKYLTYLDKSGTPYINDDAQFDYFYQGASPLSKLNVDFYIYDAKGNQICRPGDNIYYWQFYDDKSTLSGNTRLIFSINDSNLNSDPVGGGWYRLVIYDNGVLYNKFYPYNVARTVHLTTPDQTENIEVNIGGATGITLLSGSAVEFGFEVSGSTNSTTPAVNSDIKPTRNFRLNSGTLKALYYTSNGATLYTITGSKIINFSGSNTISFTSSMYPTPINSYYYPNTGSSLYSVYGDIDYSLPPQENDLIVFAPTDINKRKEFTITNTYVSNSIFSMEVTPQFYNLEAISSSFLILNRRPNETNIVLNTLKNPGQTSYGYIIPKDVNPNILNNISTINESVKNKLLADQQGNTTYQ
jgi:hypothetical protein